MFLRIQRVFFAVEPPTERVSFFYLPQVALVWGIAEVCFMGPLFAAPRPRCRAGSHREQSMHGPGTLRVTFRYFLEM